MAARIAVPNPAPRLARSRTHHGRCGGEGICHTSPAAATGALSPGSPGHADRLLGPPPELLRILQQVVRHAEIVHPLASLSIRAEGVQAAGLEIRPSGVVHLKV